jgi:hypothetical protein
MPGTLPQISRESCSVCEHLARDSSQSCSACGHPGAQAKGLVKSTEAQQADILHFQRRTLDALVRMEEDERARLKCPPNP